MTRSVCRCHVAFALCLIIHVILCDASKYILKSLQIRQYQHLTYFHESLYFVYIPIKEQVINYCIIYNLEITSALLIRVVNRPRYWIAILRFEYPMRMSRSMESFGVLIMKICGSPVEIEIHINKNILIWHCWHKLGVSTVRTNIYKYTNIYIYIYIIQIKICAEIRDMLPRPRLVCQEPGLRPIGRSPGVPDKPAEAWVACPGILHRS